MNFAINVEGSIENVNVCKRNDVVKEPIIDEEEEDDDYLNAMFIFQNRIYFIFLKIQIFIKLKNFIFN